MLISTPGNCQHKKILPVSNNHKYNSDDPYISFVFTLFFNSCPTLKNGSFFGRTSTFLPVFGFLPVYGLYSLTEKLPKPLISILSPFFRLLANPLKIRLMMSIVSFLSGFL